MCKDDVVCPSDRAHVVELTVAPDQCCYGWAHGRTGCPDPATTHLLTIAVPAACTLALCDSHGQDVLARNAHYIVIGQHQFGPGCNTTTPMWRSVDGRSWCEQ